MDQSRIQHCHTCDDACTYNADDHPVAQRTTNPLIELVAILIIDVFLRYTLVEAK